jgi:hypothetical protein
MVNAMNEEEFQNKLRDDIDSIFYLYQSNMKQFEKQAKEFLRNMVSAAWMVGHSAGVQQCTSWCAMETAPKDKLILGKYSDDRIFLIRWVFDDAEVGHWCRVPDQISAIRELTPARDRFEFPVAWSLISGV